MAIIDWQDTTTGFVSSTDTGCYEIKWRDDKWGCLREGALCGLFKNPVEAKRIHRQAA